MVNILTVFAGRKPNLEILIKYLTKALTLKILDEVHFWNNTKNSYDEEYLKSVSNLKRTMSLAAGHYIKIFTPIVNGSFSLKAIAKNDIHILIEDGITEKEYEIVLNGFNGKTSVLRMGKIEILRVYDTKIASNEYNITVSVVDNRLCIFTNDKLIMDFNMGSPFDISNIYLKTGHNCVGDFMYEQTKNKGFYFMDTCEKSWKNYYNYYNNPKFADDIILKCDDDILFIDLNKLPNFIKFIRDNDYDLVFANTINNGVSAYYQQNKYGLIPKSLINLEYVNGWGGSLWESGKKANKLHNYFIENYKQFLDYNYNEEMIPINIRFSINFFGYKGNKWGKIINCYGDDEHNLTVDYVNNRQFKNILYTDCYVSHLSFYKQIETGIDLCDLIEKYANLSKIILS
jgi:hypothetical protein